MAVSIDLNADMGESYGAWTMGQDEELLGVITSANIACGYHGGDPLVMTKTVRAALAAEVAIGAHPGFPDLQGFGRRRMHVDHQELAAMIRYQIGALQAIARAEGGALNHVKLHGALSNMACEDETLARACFEAVASVASDAVLFILPGTAMAPATEGLGLQVAFEIFADRAYAEDATLVPRGQPGAVIHDADTAAARMVEMVQAGAILTASGAKIPTDISTICVHGDTPGALEIARSVRAALIAADVDLKAPIR
ncbi:MAG: 5-oxoprolinase subunit PxpA [Rhodobacteraceae bacterium]|nr:5-oxoprolinase subunit PxpA [Paracoccaceae bacterium]